MSESSREETIERFLELVSDIDIAMLTTVAVDGSLHTRPMATLKPSSAQELWFFTAVDSVKTDEIDREHEVALAYAHPGRNQYVAVSGTANIVRDVARARELWTPFAGRWFPEGPDDPSLRLLRVRPHHVEFWDSKGKSLRILFDAARSMVGKPPSGSAGDHGSARL